MDDVEELRQKILREMHNDFSSPEETLEKYYQPGTFGCHEAMHTAGLLSETVYHQLLRHPSIALNQEWFNQANFVSSELIKLFNMIAAEQQKNVGIPS